MEEFDEDEVPINQNNNNINNTNKNNDQNHHIIQLPNQITNNQLENGYYVDDKGNSFFYDWGKGEWVSFDQQPTTTSSTNTEYSVQDQTMPIDNIPRAPDFSKLQKGIDVDYMKRKKEKKRKEMEKKKEIAKKKEQGEEKGVGVGVGGEEAQTKKKQRKKKKKNTSVFVKGLPKDITIEELAEFMVKYGGIIKKDPETRELKIKIYKDHNEVPTGEALVTYFLPESVQQALTFADGNEIRSGFIIKVEEATFDSKKDVNNNDQNAKRKRKVKKVYDQKKELDWDEEDKRVHVILKNMFTLNEAARGGMEFFVELKKEILEEMKELGPVDTIKIFERNPKGVIAVKFKYPLTAQRCVRIMNGRFFDGRKIEVEFYDEFTNYNVQETEEERLKRQKEFDLWIGNTTNDPSSSSISSDVIQEKQELTLDDLPDQKNEDEDTLNQLKGILDDDYSNSSSSDDSDDSSDD